MRALQQRCSGTPLQVRENNDGRSDTAWLRNSISRALQSIWKKAAHQKADISPHRSEELLTSSPSRP